MENNMTAPKMRLSGRERWKQNLFKNKYETESPRTDDAKAEKAVADKKKSDKKNKKKEKNQSPNNLTEKDKKTPEDYNREVEERKVEHNYTPFVMKKEKPSRNDGAKKLPVRIRRIKPVEENTVHQNKIEEVKSKMVVNKPFKIKEGKPAIRDEFRIQSEEMPQAIVIKEQKERQNNPEVVISKMVVNKPFKIKEEKIPKEPSYKPEVVFSKMVVNKPVKIKEEKTPKKEQRRRQSEEMPRPQERIIEEDREPSYKLDVVLSKMVVNKPVKIKEEKIVKQDEKRKELEEMQIPQERVIEENKEPFYKLEEVKSKMVANKPIKIKEEKIAKQDEGKTQLEKMQRPQERVIEDPKGIRTNPEEESRVLANKQIKIKEDNTIKSIAEMEEIKQSEKMQRPQERVIEEKSIIVPNKEIKIKEDIKAKQFSDHEKFNQSEKMQKPQERVIEDFKGIKTIPEEKSIVLATKEIKVKEEKQVKPIGETEKNKQFEKMQRPQERVIEDSKGFEITPEGRSRTVANREIKDKEEKQAKPIGETEKIKQSEKMQRPQERVIEDSKGIKTIPEEKSRVLANKEIKVKEEKQVKPIGEIEKIKQSEKMQRPQERVIEDSKGVGITPEGKSRTVGNKEIKEKEEKQAKPIGETEKIKQSEKMQRPQERLIEDSKFPRITPEEKDRTVPNKEIRTKQESNAKPIGELEKIKQSEKMQKPQERAIEDFRGARRVPEEKSRTLANKEIKGKEDKNVKPVGDYEKIKQSEKMQRPQERVIYDTPNERLEREKEKEKGKDHTGVDVTKKDTKTFKPPKEKVTGDFKDDNLKEYDKKTNVDKGKEKKDKLEKTPRTLRGNLVSSKDSEADMYIEPEGKLSGNVKRTEITTDDPKANRTVAKECQCRKRKREKIERVKNKQQENQYAIKEEKRNLEGNNTK